MCSVILLRRPGHDWPLLVAANRDEMLHRPWLPPARHWPDRPEVVAGLDETAGGSWLGLNDTGVVAAILNGENALGPLSGKRSRGELVLEALDHADASAAVAALSELDPAAYRPFNMLIADNRDAAFLSNRASDPDGGGGALASKIRVQLLPPGLSMVTAVDPNAMAASSRQRRYLPLFQSAPVPEPQDNGEAGGDWSGWVAILSRRDSEDAADPRGAMNIVTEVGFGTSSTSLIAIPSIARLGSKPIWMFAAGRPDEATFTRIRM